MYNDSDKNLQYNPRIWYNTRLLDTRPDTTTVQEERQLPRHYNFKLFWEAVYCHFN